jgi:hypothetical protein
MSINVRPKTHARTKIYFRVPFVCGELRSDKGAALLEYELSSTDESNVDLDCASTGSNLVKKAYRSCQKYKPPALCLPLSTGRRLLGLLFVQTVKVKLTLRPAPTIQNTAKNNIIYLHTQDTTELQFNAFLTGKQRLLIINISLASSCQSQR